MQFKALSLTFAALAAPAIAGINCEGSSECAGLGVSQLVTEFQNQVNAGKGEEFFYSGSQIGCSNDNICAFFQFGGQNGNTNLALKMAQELQDHGCKACGSVPTNPGNPDVGTGALTLNYVTDTCCTPENGAVSCYCEQNSIKSGTPAGVPCQNCF